MDQKDLFPYTNIVKIYNGIDVNKIAITSDKSRFNKDVIVMAIVGRICATKNQWDAVNAVELLLESGYSNIKLLIIGYMGTDPYELDMYEYVQKNKLDKYIEFVTFTNNLQDVLAKCDIGLMCSIAEAFGRVTIEYMMAGLLTIGANIGGTSELIKDQIDGLLYIPNNPENLAHQILWAIEHTEDANRIALEGQKMAKENFSIEQTAEKVLSVYKNILNI